MQAMTATYMETGSDREVCILKQTLKATERPLIVSFGPDAIVHISCAELNKDRNQSLGHFNCLAFAQLLFIERKLEVYVAGGRE